MNKLIPLICLALFPSCSVVMAAKKDGVNPTKVQSCHTRAQFVSLGGKVIHTERLPNGDLLETYQIPMERGSIARAVLHGILDLNTLCLWEIAGTPIEGCMNKQEFFAISVTYGPDDIAKSVSVQ